MGIAKLRFELGLHQLLSLCQRKPGDHHGTRLGKRNSALAIDGLRQLLRYSAPDIQCDSVAWAQHVIRPSRQVHRKLRQTDSVRTEDFRPESLESLGVIRKMRIKRLGRSEEHTSELQ